MIFSIYIDITYFLYCVKITKVIVIMVILKKIKGNSSVLNYLLKLITKKYNLIIIFLSIGT